MREISFEAASWADLSAEQRLEVEAMLRNGRFAPVPPTAVNLRFGTWTGVFTGDSVLRFEAEPTAIDEFIQDSPGLDGQPARQYSIDEQLLPRSEYEAGTPHHYDQEDTVIPWYRPTIRVEGRAYGVPAVGEHSWGYVLVDDDAGMVWLEVVWS